MGQICALTCRNALRCLTSTDVSFRRLVSRLCHLRVTLVRRRCETTVASRQSARERPSLRWEPLRVRMEPIGSNSRSRAQGAAFAFGSGTPDAVVLATGGGQAVVTHLASRADRFRGAGVGVGVGPREPVDLRVLTTQRVGVPLRGCPHGRNEGRYGARGCRWRRARSEAQGTLILGERPGVCRREPSFRRQLGHGASVPHRRAIPRRFAPHI